MNEATGFVAEPGNSAEYNVVMRLVSWLPFASGTASVHAVRAMKDFPCTKVPDWLRPPRVAENVMYADNEGHRVPYTMTRFGGDPNDDVSSTADLTILYAHGGGMIGGCMDNDLLSSDMVSTTWKRELNLREVQVANVEYRLLPTASLEDAIGDFLAVYDQIVNVHGVDPRRVVFTGCSGGGAMTFYSFLQILRLGLWPRPKIVMVHSMGPSLEWTTSFPATGWEDTQEWVKNDANNHAFFFSREAGREWGRMWPNESRVMAQTWLRNESLIGKLSKEVIMTVGEHEMFAATHRAFLKDARRAGSTLQFVSVPNRTHCLQFPGFSALTGPEGADDTTNIFQAIRRVWEKPLP